MQLKTKSLFGKYVHVLSTDPALNFDPVDLGEDPTDAEREEAAKAREDAVGAYKLALDSSDLGKLPLREGKTPTVWELTHLSSDAASWLLDQGGTEGNLRLSLHAIAMAVAGIKGGVKDEDGKLVPFKRAPRASRGGFLALPDDLVHALTTNEDGSLNVPLIKELGGRIARQLVPRNG